MTEPKKEDERKGKAKTIAVVVAAAFLLLVLILALRATQSEEPPQPFDDVPPRVSFIKAELDPPFTRYSVFASDLDEQVLTYAWSLAPAEPGCTVFTFDGPRASWQHDGDGCSHDRPDAHGGTITVVVSDGRNEVTRTYEGGAAAHDPDPLYPED